MNDLFIEYFYKKFEFRAGRINLISDYFFVWVGLPLLIVIVAMRKSKINQDINVHRIWLF